MKVQHFIYLGILVLAACQNDKDDPQNLEPPSTELAEDAGEDGDSHATAQIFSTADKLSVFEIVRQRLAKDSYKKNFSELSDLTIFNDDYYIYAVLKGLNPAGQVQDIFFACHFHGEMMACHRKEILEVTVPDFEENDFDDEEWDDKDVEKL